MSCKNQIFVSQQCAATSVGTSNQLFLSLIQTIIATQCAISPPSLWPKDFGPDAISQRDLNYDFIVIGGGSAGSTVAGRLSENKNWNVLLLEAGGDPPIESEVPALFGNIQYTENDWQFRPKPENVCLALDGGCYWPRGKMLGGSGAMNGMLYVRGNERDWNDMAIAGNIGWDYKTVLKYFKKSEGNQYQPFIGKYHSATGPLKVGFYGGDIPTASIFQDAGAEIGFPFIEDINADKFIGYSIVQGIVHNGRRCSSAKAYLAANKNRTNLNVIKHAFVKRILINDKNQAYGVEFDLNGNILQAFASKEVVLSAGSIMSPVILMHSGIGPKEHLTQHNISCKSNLPVGNNLHDDLMIYLMFKMNKTGYSSPPALDSIYNLAIHNNGTFTNIGLTQLEAFLNTNPSAKYPNYVAQHFWFYHNTTDFNDYQDLLRFSDAIQNATLPINQDYDIAISATTLIKAKSQGTIRLNGTSPFNKPIIQANYLTNDNDVQTLLKAVKQQLSLTKTKAFQKYNAEFIRLPICSDYEFLSDDYLICYIRHMSYPGSHMTGTSKMGSILDKESVVDSRLRVRGIWRLRQADAGIIPDGLSGNINAPTIMIGERAADFLKEEYH